MDSKGRFGPLLRSLNHRCQQPAKRDRGKKGERAIKIVPEHSSDGRSGSSSDDNDGSEKQQSTTSTKGSQTEEE